MREGQELQGTLIEVETVLGMSSQQIRWSVWIFLGDLEGKNPLPRMRLVFTCKKGQFRTATLWEVINRR